MGIQLGLRQLSVITGCRVKQVSVKQGSTVVSLSGMC